nr:phosphodiester glycosidase family protein [Paenibacillus oryzae]
MKKKLLLSLGGLLLAVMAALYLLADRYLIEHVELVVTPSPIAADTDGSAGGAEEDKSSGSIVKDDWNYASDDISIAIREVQEGEGDDRITYYVADVELSDLSSLSAAFAKNSFGRNIIEPTSAIAENNGALFAINGDYYGFRDDGVIIRNGVLYRDEPVRDAMAIFRDGSVEIFNENSVASRDLLARKVLHTYSFGPALVADGKAKDGLDQVAIDTNFGNRSIEDANPRTAFGIIDSGHYLFIVVDGRSRGYSRGMTLNELADLFVKLGASEAYNLDG